MNKVKVFEHELNLIQNPDVRKFAIKCVENTPDYFYTVAASSTGKYHPEFSLGDGGLIRHTKAVCLIAQELLGLEHNRAKFNPTERDLIIVAAILHDSFKHGKEFSQYTIADHPAVASSFVRDMGLKELPDEQQPFAYLIAEAILTHMGEWNVDYKTKKEIMPKPTSDMQIFVHECDLLASRKWMSIDFGDNYYAGQDVYKVQAQIVALCKERITVSKDKENLRSYLYDIIGALNRGEKNPLKIRDIRTANRVYEAIEEYGTDEHINEGTSGFEIILNEKEIINE